MHDEMLPRQITTEQRAARWPKTDPGPPPEVNGAENFGIRLAWARARAGLTHKGLAQDMNCAQSALQKWENGKVSPTVVTAEHLARVLRVRPAWLTFGLEAFEPIDLPGD